MRVLVCVCLRVFVCVCACAPVHMHVRVSVRSACPPEGAVDDVTVFVVGGGRVVFGGEG